MNKNSMRHGRLFFDTYLPEGGRVVEIGSYDVNGSLRDAAPPGCDYTGLDFAEGPGVDIVLTDPYSLPIDSGIADAVVSSSCFEHSEFFWLSFMEALRLLKPSGLLYINAPSNGAFHRHPVDCWRFYPDSGMALRNWARRNHVNAEMLESYTAYQDKPGSFNDYIAVFVKDAAYADQHPRRMKDQTDHLNGIALGEDDLSNAEYCPEDQWKKTAISTLFRI